ncbi:MAG: DUF1003 domain-containing protein [Actinomycetes bacterium]
MDDTSTQPTDADHALTCAACRIIDRADGREDGKVFDLAHWDVPSERQHFRRLLTEQDRIADKVTNFAGSLQFVYIHIVWFVIWIVINVGLIGVGAEFDKKPFGTLTLIVSLEAIFLSTFVMVSQNRQAKRSDLRSQIDFESNLRSLIWTAHVAEKVGVDIEHVEGIVQAAVAEARRVIGDETAPTTPSGSAATA